ncbi:MAG: hypothetical protein IJE72_00265 [Clostridia bacterium]|nr:hypothetical protein [Clostridia bacterium]
MWSAFGSSFLVKLISMVFLSFAVAVNGIGNYPGTGDIVETNSVSSYALTTDNRASSQDISFENENLLYIRSSFRKLFNRYFNAFGIKGLISATDIELDRNKLSIPAGTDALIDADILPSNARNTNIYL